MLPSQLKEQDIFSQQSSSVGKLLHSSGRAGRLFKILIVVILVIGVIAGTAFMLFSNRAVKISSSIPIGGPIGPIKTPVLVQSQNGGLDASLRVTSGPYFLSELLGVQITLTNHSNKSFLLQGKMTEINYCLGIFSVTTVGGSEPHFNLPVVNSFMSCPTDVTQFDAGKTLMAQGYVPLTKSGQVIITPYARFLSTGKDRYGNEVTTDGKDPLAGHWPVIHIFVNAKIPIDRTLTLQQQGSLITIDAPAVTKSHLVYFDSVSCVTEPSGTEFTTSGKWDPVSTLTLQQPECSGTHMHWLFAVSAPGYAIASGEISS